MLEFFNENAKVLALINCMNFLYPRLLLLLKCVFSKNVYFPNFYCAFTRCFSLLSVNAEKVPLRRILSTSNFSVSVKSTNRDVIYGHTIFCA